MRIVCLSDTHGHHWGVQVPDGDLLIHAGDFSHGEGSLEQVADFNAWLGTLSHPHKVVIAGNNDLPLQKQPECSRLLTNATYLRDQAVQVGDLKVYGSPWQPEHFNWAFNLPRGGPELAATWQAIPSDTAILVTHGPAFGIQDKTAQGSCVGCSLLEARVRELKKLQLHVFGHIHESYGRAGVGGVTHVNASVLDSSHRLANVPLLVEL